MIEMNGDNLIRLLGRPEWDEEVREMTKQLGLGRVEISSSNFSEDFYIEKYQIVLEFGSLPATEKQYAEEEIGNLYYSQVSFEKNCTMLLPFGLNRGETFLKSIKKITALTGSIYRFRYDFIDRLLIESDSLKYFFVVKYSEDGARELETIVVYPMDVKEDYNALKGHEAPLDIE